MKKVYYVLPFFIIVLLNSCTTTYQNAAYKKAEIIDYTKYVNQGLFITESTTVPFDYIPIGSVTAITKDGEDRIGEAVGERDYKIIRVSSSMFSFSSAF